MEMHPETKNTANVSPVIPNVIMQFPDQITQQVNDPKGLPIELTTGTNILELNEDCLLEIFSVKSLTLMDLCSLAETCRRFQQITRRVFPKDLKIYISEEGHFLFTSRHYSIIGDHRADDPERILKNFGSILTEIQFSSYEEPLNFVLNLVAKYCVDSLDSLRIFWNGYGERQISEEVTVGLKPIFKRLQTLHLFDVEIVDNKKLFADFDSLIELDVFGVKNYSALENTFPKLERFICCDSPFLVDDLNRVVTFISRHPNLKKLHLVCECCILQTIANSCKDLEELTIGMGCDDSCSLQPLQALTSLKMLKLGEANCENLKFLSGLPQLRELHLIFCDKSDDFVGQFAFLNQVTKLHMYRMEWLVASDVVEIIKHLTNLEELSVPVKLDEKTFSRIVDVVKGRPRVLTLECYFFFDLKNCDKNQKVRLRNFV